MWFELTYQSKSRSVAVSLSSKLFSAVPFDPYSSKVLQLSLTMCCFHSTFHRLCSPSAWSHRHFRLLLSESNRSSANWTSCKKVLLKFSSFFLTWTVKLLSNLNLDICVLSLSSSLMLEHECDLCKVLGLALPISFLIGRGVKVCFKIFDALT